MDVEVKQSDIPGAGRGLFASRDFDSGDVVLSLSRPYVAELETERMNDTCAWCFTGGEYASMLTAVSGGQPDAGPPPDLRSCTGCRKARYCSKTCQTRAWKREHRHECRILASNPVPALPHAARAVIKLLGRLKSRPDNPDDALLSLTSFKPGADEASLEDFHRLAPQDAAHYSLLAHAAWTSAGSPDLGALDSESLARRLFLNISLNALTLSSPLRDEPLGLAFDPLLCAANHSCEPNARVCFGQPAVALRALRPVRRGEEVRLAYVDVSNPSVVRRRELREAYFFSCGCRRCRLGEGDGFVRPVGELSPRSLALADALIGKYGDRIEGFAVPAAVGGDEVARRRVAALQAEGFGVSGVSGEYGRANRGAGVAEVRGALGMCVDSGLWGWARQPVPHLVRLLLLMHVGAEGQYPAWRIGAKMYVEILPVLYEQRFHPERVVHCFLMMRLTNNLCQEEGGEVYREILESGLDLRVVFFGFLLEFHEQVGLCYGRESHMERFAESIYEGLVLRAPMSQGEIRKRVEATWPKFEVVAKSVDILRL